ncbi:MAG TPA: hypothetical protein VE974_06910 [Thermoanaerobaculia bacterium]|nr:hypothetical protein [Thermoanaerobaculia bacterium]
MERKLDPTPEEWERVWVEEAARRYQQLKAGTARSIASDVKNSPSATFSPVAWPLIRPSGTFSPLDAARRATNYPSRKTES